jgi:Fic family protein
VLVSRISIFESIHPFEDGNGRIGRALSEKYYLMILDIPVLFSLSNLLYKPRKEYYLRLNEASYTLEISPWITFFVNLVLEAQKESEHEIKNIVLKANFWKSHQNHLNDRQIKLLQ